MLHSLEVKNFKSIRQLKLDCRRVNIFIGEPNTGKSNILESLALLSFLCYSNYSDSAMDFIRFDSISNLFYDDDTGSEVDIKCNDIRLNINYRNGRFQGDVKEGDETLIRFDADYTNLNLIDGQGRERLAPFKYYKFRIIQKYERQRSDFLLPPSGENLMSLLLSKKELRALANQPFSSTGLRLGLRPQEYKIEVIKDSEDVIVSYPYSSVVSKTGRLDTEGSNSRGPHHGQLWTSQYFDSITSCDKC